MTFIYFVLKKCAEVLRTFYFRKVFVVGTANIPTDGPVIICGNHANQFIDPVMIASCSSREISFTMAASSFSQPIVGSIAKSLNAIPVKRPEDYKVKGRGKIVISGNVVTGIGTSFITEISNFENGASLLVKGKFLSIIMVESETVIKIGECNDLNEVLDNKLELEYFVSYI